MRKYRTWAALAALCLGLGLARRAASEEAPAATTKSGSLYPADFGPAELDVSSYPKPLRESYKLMVFKCAACHTAARPINSQFLELTEAEAKEAKAKEPELFKDEKVVKVEEKVWSRYVKRMMAKPGCPVKGDDGKKIYDFLVYDSKLRKMGEAGKEFRASREKLLADFKAKHADVYAQLFQK